MLAGEDQEWWLPDGLRHTAARWNATAPILNPHVRVEVSADRWRTDVRNADTIAVRTAPVASYGVVRPGGRHLVLHSG
jgi:hypothetical protein